MYIAVLRRLSAAGHVVAYLEHNDVLHPDAVNQITMLHTNDFRPGAMARSPANSPPSFPAGNYEFYPSFPPAVRTGDVGIVRALLATRARAPRHVSEIVKPVTELSLHGIDIAYMDLPADQRTVVHALHRRTRPGPPRTGQEALTLTLPAPDRDRRPAIDEGAYDWAETREARRHPPDGAPTATRAPTGSKCPPSSSTSTARVDPAKLVITVTPYRHREVRRTDLRAMTDRRSDGHRRHASSSTPPTVERSSQATTSSRWHEHRQGQRDLRGVQWSPEVAHVYSSPTSSMANRTIWIENVFSIGFKLEYIPQFELGGVAIEDASDDLYLGNIWPALIPFISSGTAGACCSRIPNDLAPVWRRDRRHR